MSEQSPYESDAASEGVLFARTDQIKSYAIHPHNLPKYAWGVALEMNKAYRRGYAQAQEDMRAALGMKG